METAAQHIELLYDKAKKYTETSLELYKLNAIDIASDVISSLVSRIALVLILSFFTLFINIGISLLIGDMLGAYYLGFLVVSGFYLILAILIYFFSEQLIESPITNLVIAKLLKSRKKEHFETQFSNDEK